MYYDKGGGKMSKSYNMKDVIIFIVSAVFMFGGGLLPISEESVITPFGVQVIGIFVGLVIGWCGSSLFWPSILAIAALGITQYGDASTVLCDAFNNSTVMMILLGFVCFAPISYSGVGEILMNKLLSLKVFAGKPFAFLLTIFIGTFLLAALNAISTALIVVILSLLSNMCKQIGYKNTDMFPAFLFTGFMLSMCFGRNGIPFLGWPLMTLGQLRSFGLEISYGAFFVMIIPTYLITIVVFTFLMKVVCGFDKLKASSLEIVEGQAKTKMTKYQKSVLLMMLIVIVFSLIVSFVGNANGNGLQLLLYKIGVIGVMAIGISLSVIIRVEGEPILNMRKAYQCVPLDMLFMFAVAILVSTMLTAEETGVNVWIATTISPILSSMNGYVILLIIALFTLILTNLANNLVVTFTMLAIVGNIFTVNPTIDVMVAGTAVALTGITGILLPSASVYGAMVYGESMTTSKTSFIAALSGIIIMMFAIGLYMIPVGQIIS